MFTQIYNTAKRILSRSPSVHGRSSETRDSPQDPEATMVTTRRGTDTPGSDATPRSSTKRRRVGKRELDALDTPTQVKRQRRTPARKQEGEDGAKSATPESSQVSTEGTEDTIAVTLPRSESPTEQKKLPIRRHASPLVVVAKSSPPVPVDVEASENDSQTPTTKKQSGSKPATPNAEKDGEGSPTPRAKRASGRLQASAEKSGSRSEPTHIEVEETTVRITPDEIPSSSLESEQATLEAEAEASVISSTPKKAHMRFGSEEPATTTGYIKMNAQGHKRYEAPSTTDKTVQDVAQPEEEDDSGSDSDEAPEVVTTTAAASKAAATQAEATRALEAQQEKERQKREAREQRIAAEQAEKRKREDKKAKKLAKQLAKQQTNEVDEEEEIKPPSALDKRNIPALLPDSLLSALPDQRAPTPPPETYGKTEEQLRKEKLNRHIKFLERVDKGPKDIKKGKLSVAVLGQHKKALPPKVNRDSKNLRESWLKGRSVEKKKGGKPNFMKSGKMERKGFGNKGFLRGDD